ncbi:SurA N-terminal domain-containing protein [Streptomyces sp. NPDC006267]|uniref:SurA N-terminal domain-containing protein n=1 Tax=Streptomyces sp. NPDC006267 TaxID=3157173 RepID=UPI0033B47438
MHRRRRTALAVLAATLLAAPLLSACGNQAHPGAAAVVGGERIEVSAVQGRAADVRAAQESSPQAEQLVNKSGQLNRAKLHGLIFARILDRAAADAGVTVTRNEVQEMRRASRAQQGGEKQFQAMMLQQRWVAPDQIDADMRQEVQLPKLAEALGADLGTPAGQQVVGEALTKASKALDIDVNPRFGSWDDQKMQLGAYSAPWITQVTEFPPKDSPAGA